MRFSRLLNFGGACCVPILFAVAPAIEDPADHPEGHCNKPGGIDSTGDEVCNLQVQSKHGFVAVGEGAAVKGSGGAGAMRPSAGLHKKHAGTALTLGVDFGQPGTEEVVSFLYVTPVFEAGKGPADIPPKRVIIDTGSSSLGLCPIPDVPSHGELVLCDGYSPGEEWWGYTYNMSLEVNPSVNGDELTIQNAAFAIMQADHPGFCSVGDGIFGIAFKELNSAGVLKNPNDTKPFPCIEHIDYVGDAQEPLLSHLRQEGGVERLGIYWTGQLGQAEGTLYLDDAAISNVHYPQDQSKAPMKAWLGESGYYEIDIQTISVNGLDFPVAGTAFDCTSNLSFGPCILDTGTPGMNLPPDVIDAIYSNGSSPSTSIVFNLKGWQGGDIVPLSFTRDQLDKLHVWNGAGPPLIATKPANVGEGVILGWLTWAFYYIAFDITNKAVEFVPHQVCAVGDHVKCPGSNDMCSRDQCCPRIADTGGKTFPCPSAPADFDGCEHPSKVENCIPSEIHPFHRGMYSDFQ